ncbi:MAG TPA: J domain-containing protein, partial [Anaerolineae bacterium]|nr:J domain-containing protein [Anaerolineae bacterium]
GGVNFNDIFGGGRGGGDFSDFFSSIFGGMGGAQQAGGFRGGGRSSQRLNMEQEVMITLEEAYQGTTRTFTTQSGSSFTAKIPAGADTGNKIRLRGKGHQAGQGQVGDLFLVVKVREHGQFERQGDDLAVVVDIDVPTAVLGGKATVPTLTGSVTLTIPAGTSGGQSIRLSGKGMPKVKQKGQFGDLYAKMRIKIPRNLTEEERALYEQLAALKGEAV